MRNWTCLCSAAMVLLLVGCSSAGTPPVIVTPASIALADPITPTEPPLATIPAPTVDADPWRIVIQIDRMPHPTTLAGFLNEDLGVTVGYAGEVHYTTDGGQTWPAAVNNSWCRFGLEIVDEQVAWHCGNGGHVRVSTDGGKTWESVTDYGPNEPNHCRFLSFLDAQTGWAAGPGYLGSTADGGQTWTAVTLPEGIGHIIAVSLRTATDGYVLDDHGTLYVTSDGGQSWSSLAVELDRPFPMNMNAPTVAMRFLDENNGVIVASFLEQPFEVRAVRTADGGQTWAGETVPVPPGFLYLSRDGRTLTSTGLGVTVARYEE